MALPSPSALPSSPARINTALTSSDVAFLVPGDLTFYSPFQCLVDNLENRAVVIPGVGTANVASAFLKNWGEQNDDMILRCQDNYSKEKLEELTKK